MSFEDILDKPATQIDRPKALPIGSYIWTIQGLPRVDKSAKKGTPFYEFTLKCAGALDDVDEEALAEWAKKSDGTSRVLTEFTTKLTFYITEESLYRLQEFLQHCGLEGDDKTTRQLIDETPNCQFVGYITHQTSQDGTNTFANISRTAPVED